MDTIGCEARTAHSGMPDLFRAGHQLAHFSSGQGTSVLPSSRYVRLHEEFKRRIKTQTVLPSAETAAMLFWALLASGQITMRKIDGWQTLAEKPTIRCIDLAA
jgi:putative transposase